MLFLLILACAGNQSEDDETSSNSDITTEENSEQTDADEQDLEKIIAEDISAESLENSEEENSEDENSEEEANQIPELPPEILASMTEKEKQVYYAMIFRKNQLPKNKTVYDDEYPLLTPDRDLYIAPERNSLVQKEQIKKKFTTEGFSETFFFDSYNSEIYGIIRQQNNNIMAAKGEIIVLADGWKGSVRWHPKVLSQCILEFQIPVFGLILDPIPLRTKLGYTKHPYEWHTAWLQDYISTSKQIDAQEYPAITFYSTHCTENTQKKKPISTDNEKRHHILFHGYLSMNGVEHSINIKGAVTERIIPKKHDDPKSPKTHNYISQLELSGIFHFNHSDFNISPYMNPFLLIANSDLITVHYNLLNSNE
jgi:hypothetical protein